MKDTLKAFDIPLAIAIGVTLASLIGKRNIFKEELVPFIICIVAGWTISYLIRRYRNRKLRQDNSRAGQLQ